jgi:hypothetical protein
VGGDCRRQSPPRLAGGGRHVKRGGGVELNEMALRKSVSISALPLSSGRARRGGGKCPDEEHST